MTTKDYLERMKRIKAQRKLRDEKEEDIKNEYWEATAKDRKLNTEILDKGICAIYKMVADKRKKHCKKCSCCSCDNYRNPDSIDLCEDDGIFYVRWDADHPSDIRDREYSIEELMAYLEIKNK